MKNVRTSLGDMKVFLGGTSFEIRKKWKTPYESSISLYEIKDSEFCWRRITIVECIEMCQSLKGLVNWEKRKTIERNPRVIRDNEW